ncbi:MULTISPECIES: polysaccharide biosynthesis protein [unclassified Marinobacter]|uniref:polysaccharide biosynthesis protein n=1 Tax=unclassified Marinobacter TaxID=83889 RepID=UPI001907CE59|nr:polysaccharide biosynthesis protein [Marinobacter sp. 1-4A]MBK1849829.1 polysaccharide biosynthesis protein [Marinobacter sp. 1-4A]
MDDNKLYKALLKSQSERRQIESDRGEAKAEDNFRKERPYAGSDRDKPNWTRVETNDNERPPTVYDSSVSLSLIGNPKPWSREQLRERKIIYSGMADKEVMDAYRELRIQLRNRAGEGNFIVMFSSLGKGHGGLLTAYNLAAAFALDSHTSALLVDCDPYGNELNSLVSSPMTSGVTDFVADRSLKIQSILYPSGVERLTVIPAGTQASSAVELFSAVRMRELITELKARYPDRCIVLNAPPFQENTEARILERFADQIIFGVPFGEVTAEVIEDSVDALGSDKFSGLIFQE